MPPAPGRGRSCRTTRASRRSPASSCTPSTTRDPSLRRARIVVVGGGASAVQFLGELAPVADTIWVTRRPPVWRTGEFTPRSAARSSPWSRSAYAAGLPPASVVSVTGLKLRPQEREAERLGAYQRRPMFARIEPDGVRGTTARSSRPTSSSGPRDSGRRSSTSRRCTCAASAAASSSTAPPRGRPRVQLVGYGPSASTIGANRAGRVAARNVRRWLADHDARPSPDAHQGAGVTYDRSRSRARGQPSSASEPSSSASS